MKTHEARTVRLPRSITDELAAHLTGRPRGRGPGVPGAAGRADALVEVDHAVLQAGRLAAGLPERLRLYDLRHTCASLLIREGATVKAVQAQLGHATASITLDTYGHLFPDELDQLAGRLEAARAEALDARRRPSVAPGYPSSFRSAKAQVSEPDGARRRWDSNPRGPLGSGDFQGRCLRPLGHSSGP